MLVDEMSSKSYSANLQSQLNGFVNTVIYNSNGLPTSVDVGFQTDFTIDQVGKQVGDVYVAWTLSETGTGDLYSPISQDSDITLDSTNPASATTITFTLTPSGTSPSVETFDVILDASLMYVNTNDYTVEMFRQQYKITVTVTSVDPIATNPPSLATPAVIPSNVYSPGTTDTTKVASVLSPVPQNLNLVASGAPFAHPHPIVVMASTTDTNYKVWHASATSILIRDGSSPTSMLLYEWPAGLVSATSTAESGSTSSVTVTLNDVPTAIYNQGTIYIHLTVKFRDVHGGRRGLRRLERMEDGITTKTMVIPVDLVPMDVKESDDSVLG
jgi:hypothetical protein